MAIELWQGEVPLWDDAIHQPRPTLTPFPVENAVGAVVICPGGGYVMKADHEGAPIARMLNGYGIAAYVLDYRVAPYRHPAPLCDVQRAIRLLRAGVDGPYERIGVLGFSAGGHLAACAGTLWDDGDANAADAIARASCRPDAMVLCYPVVSFISFAHEGSHANLLGEENGFTARRALSPEERVTPRTPPAFLWHTAEDKGVPVENSLRMAAALSQHGVPFALHVFPHGIHGIGLGEDVPLAHQWPELCGAWLKDLGF